MFHPRRQGWWIHEDPCRRDVRELPQVVVCPYHLTWSVVLERTCWNIPYARAYIAFMFVMYILTMMTNLCTAGIVIIVHMNLLILVVLFLGQALVWVLDQFVQWYYPLKIFEADLWIAPQGFFILEKPEQKDTKARRHKTEPYLSLAKACRMFRRIQISRSTWNRKRNAKVLILS